mmetsp:Transcript_11579/g.34313  ORF Transcript_11579/g.34313 Transcript_11579/m.34313 type:complete len:571 (+) Transcript_11579:95-1807(+)
MKRRSESTDQDPNKLKSVRETDDVVADLRSRIASVLDAEGGGAYRVCEVLPNEYSDPGTALYTRFTEAINKHAMPSSRSIKLVWHGTPEVNINNICVAGLNAAKRGSANGQAYGPGEYFALSPGYAMCYAYDRRSHQPLPKIIRIIAFAVLIDDLRDFQCTDLLVTQDPARNLPLAVVSMEMFDSLASLRPRLGLRRLLPAAPHPRRATSAYLPSDLSDEACASVSAVHACLNTHDIDGASDAFARASARFSARMHPDNPWVVHVARRIAGIQAQVQRLGVKSELAAVLQDEVVWALFPGTFAELKKDEAKSLAKKRYAEGEVQGGGAEACEEEHRACPPPQSAPVADAMEKVVTKRLDLGDLDAASEAYARATEACGGFPLPWAAKVGYHLQRMMERDPGLDRDVLDVIFPGAIAALERVQQLARPQKISDQLHVEAWVPDYGQKEGETPRFLCAFAQVTCPCGQQLSVSLPLPRSNQDAAQLATPVSASFRCPACDEALTGKLAVRPQDDANGSSRRVPTVAGSSGNARGLLGRGEGDGESFASFMRALAGAATRFPPPTGYGDAPVV